MKNTWHIMRLRGGDTPRDAGGFLGAAHAKETYYVTYWCYALWNDEHKIIVDTCVNIDDETPWYTPVLNNVKPEERLPYQLEHALGWKPEDVDIVINTHLHYDHTGYNYLFKNADFYVQRKEYDFAMNCPTSGFGFAYKKANYDKNAVAYTSWRFLDGEQEILPGIICFPTPGHTIGHQSLLVNTEEGTLCIASDAVKTLAALEVDLNAGGPISGDVNNEAYKKIRQIAQRIIPSHDMNGPEVYDHQASGFHILKDFEPKEIVQPKELKNI